MDNNEWVYGDLHVISQRPHIHSIGSNCPFRIDTETIGQFTGLLDKNGKEIYEGDIIEYSTIVCNMNGPSLPDGKYCSGHHIHRHCFVAKMDIDFENELICSTYHANGGCDKLLESDELFNYKEGFEVIGNINDNPELINE